MITIEQIDTFTRGYTFGMVCSLASYPREEIDELFDLARACTVAALAFRDEQTVEKMNEYRARRNDMLSWFTERGE